MMRKGSITSIIIFVCLLIIAMFTLPESIIWIFFILGIFAIIWIAGETVNEFRKKTLDTEKICAICGHKISLDAKTCQYCWNKASREREMLRQLWSRNI